MESLVLYAPAKINLCLHVLGRREDGYHELAMAMQRIDLCDRVEITMGAGDGIRVHCEGVELGGGENIAARAARAVLEKTGLTRNLTINIEKMIPVAAGLGGGSSDAAAVLDGLNRMLGAPLDADTLIELGGELGADVPFFLFGRPAWATGTGTRLEALPKLPEVCYLILNPGFEVSTAWVYESLRLTKGGELANLPRFSVSTIEDLLRALHNDLETVTALRYPEIDRLKNFLREQGALGALMSGSGASVFGVFKDGETAGKACAAALDIPGWRAFVARPLD